MKPYSVGECKYTTCEVPRGNYKSLFGPNGELFSKESCIIVSIPFSNTSVKLGFLIAPGRKKVSLKSTIIKSDCYDQVICDDDKDRSPDQRMLAKEIHEMIAKKAAENFRDSDCFTNVWEWHELDPNEVVRSYVMGDCIVYVTFPSTSGPVLIKVAHPVDKDIEFSEFNLDILLRNNEQGKAVLLNSHQIGTTTMTTTRQASLTRYISIPLRFHHIANLLRFLPLDVCNIISLYQANPMCRCRQWESNVSHDCEFFPMICTISDIFDESPRGSESGSESPSESGSESASDMLDSLKLEFLTAKSTASLAKQKLGDD